jgi:hypothetical protein
MTNPPDPRPHDEAQHTLKPTHWIILFILLSLAAFLRLQGISRSSLWMDEIWSVEIAAAHGHAHDQLPLGVLRTDSVDLTTLAGAAPWWKVFSPANDYTYPPLFNLLLRFWIGLFGASPAAIRSLSAIFSIASLLIFFDLCRLVSSPKMALLASLLMTLAISQLDFAQEARCYAMLLFLTLCTANLLARMTIFGVARRRILFFVVMLCALFLTHYLSISVIIAFFLFTLLRTRGSARFKIVLAFLTAGGIILILWGYAFLWQIRHLPSATPNFLVDSQPERHLRDVIEYAAAIPAELMVGENAARRLPTIVNWLIALFILWLPLVRIRRRPDLIFWIIWAFGAIGWVVAMDMARQTLMVGYIRYTLLASPAIYAIIAGFGWPTRPFLRDGVAIFTIAIFAIIAVARFEQPPPPREDWQSAAAQINARATPGEPLVFFNTDPWVAPGMWYMCLRYYSLQSNHPWLLLDDRPNPQLLSQLEQHDSLWFIALDPQFTAPLVLPGWQIDSMLPPISQVGICHMVRTHS